MEIQSKLIEFLDNLHRIEIHEDAESLASLLDTHLNWISSSATTEIIHTEPLHMRMTYANMQPLSKYYLDSIINRRSTESAQLKRTRNLALYYYHNQYGLTRRSLAEPLGYTTPTPKISKINLQYKKVYDLRLDGSIRFINKAHKCLFKLKQFADFVQLPEVEDPSTLTTIEKLAIVLHINNTMLESPLMDTYHLYLCGIQDTTQGEIKIDKLYEFFKVMETRLHTKRVVASIYLKMGATVSHTSQQLRMSRPWVYTIKEERKLNLLENLNAEFEVSMRVKNIVDTLYDRYMNLRKLTSKFMVGNGEEIL